MSRRSLRNANPPASSSVNPDAIPAAEYAARRERVLKSLKGAAAVVFAGEGAPPLLGKWRADYSFKYLTGIDGEAGAAVVFDPQNPTPDKRVTLFLRPLNPELERWDGYRESIGAGLKDRTGFATIMRTGSLPRLLTVIARRSKRFACLHPFSTYPAPVSPDLAVFRQLAERVPGVAVEDQTEVLPTLRAIKSPAELRLMRKAAAATAKGYEYAVAAIRPGATEAAVERALEDGYRDGGAEGVSYNSIVGSGLNATVLHYMENAAALAAGDLLLIDSAASYRGYAADVTRTYPVSGRFTGDQRDVYEVVLRAQLAAIKAAKPGRRMTDVDEAARDVIDKAGYGDAFIHGIGHQLGLEVHDVTPDGPLRPGMVVTIEPGVYLPDRKLGVRIEDDILVTAKGNENLTAIIPKTVKDVEAQFAGR
jgi:Xaa-Pro aminopeptidase